MQAQAMPKSQILFHKKRPPLRTWIKLTLAEELCEAGWLDHVFSRNNLNQT